MSADIIPFGRGVQRALGVDAELERQRRLAHRRLVAFRHALDGAYTPADRALFGPAERIMHEGPQTGAFARRPTHDQGPDAA